MIKTAIVFFAASLTVSAQTFQPPSWGQGPAQGAIQQQINQLQQQIERLRAQQRQQNQPHIEAQSGMVVGHPLSGKETRRTTQTLSDGTVIDRGTNVSYFYRDGQGRMRAEGPNAVEIFDPVAHMEYEINPARRAYTHSAFSGNVSFVSIAAYGNSVASSISTGSGDSFSPLRIPEGLTEDLGQQMVNGVMAKGSRVTIAIPAGTIGNNQEIRVVNERWYSDDLQVLLKSTNNDPRFGVNIYELTDIKQTAPDPSLFNPPTGYSFIPRENFHR